MILNWLIAAVVLYSGFVALLYMAQRSLQYFPERGRTAPWTVGLTEAEEVVLLASARDRLAESRLLCESDVVFEVVRTRSVHEGGYGHNRVRSAA
jgi:hypothetical protein